MKAHQAFTIIELLIALFLSSFIMLGMMQAYRNAVSALSVCRSRMAISRKVCLLFNEIERDFSSMIVPVLYKEIVPGKDRNGNKDDAIAQKKQPDSQDTSQSQTNALDNQQEKQKKEEEAEIIKMAPVVTTYQDEIRRINQRKFELFKSINFITTHPFQVYGDKRVHLVRVLYELVLDKQKSTPNKPCYNLFRKETNDLQNSKMKKDDAQESTKQKNNMGIRTHLVADSIKEFYIELITEKPVDKDDQDKQRKKDEVEEIRLFSWGEKDFTVGSVPKALHIHIIIWDDTIKRTEKFQIFVPVFSYPTASIAELKTSLNEIVVPAAGDDAATDSKKNPDLTGPGSGPLPKGGT